MSPLTGRGAGETDRGEDDGTARRPPGVPTEPVCRVSGRPVGL
ncbi:hypothetical protein [Nocardia alni]|nr:hypothetical protein [Nocardia alni]